MQSIHLSFDSSRNKIEDLLLKLKDLQNEFEKLKVSYKYNNGWDFPELENNLKVRIEKSSEVIKLLMESEGLTELEKETFWSDFYDLDSRCIIDDYTWEKKKQKHCEFSERPKSKKSKSIDNRGLIWEESDEDRIMRRLREGNGDLEGF